MIRCANLIKRFGDHVAVNGLTLDVPAGQVLTVLGPNGAGKSTSVKMLTGLLEPTSGSIEVAGLDPAKDPVALKRRIGVLPEHLGLYGALTPLEHLKLSGRVYGLSAAETKQRAADLLKLVGLENGQHTPAERCSHGMRKKTSLAMALIHAPQVLFLDEPFEGLDPVAAAALAELLRRLAESGLTVLLTSHILALVDRVADRVLMLRAGSVVWDGDPVDLERRYFELVEAPPEVELAWLHSSRS